jgi:hypothetical protein
LCFCSFWGVEKRCAQLWYVQLYVPVSAPVFGFGGLKTRDDALDGGAASLADESIDVSCAGNSGVFSACLDNPLVDGAKNECDPIPCVKLAGNAGAANPSYCIEALDMTFGASADDHDPSKDIVVGAWKVWVVALVAESGYML